AAVFPSGNGSLPNESPRQVAARSSSLRWPQAALLLGCGQHGALQALLKVAALEPLAVDVNGGGAAQSQGNGLLFGVTHILPCFLAGQAVFKGRLVKPQLLGKLQRGFLAQVPLLTEGQLLIVPELVLLQGAVATFGNHAGNTAGINRKVHEDQLNLLRILFNDAVQGAGGIPAMGTLVVREFNYGNGRGGVAFAG